MTNLTRLGLAATASTLLVISPVFGATTKTHVQTTSVAAGHTVTINVIYPDALKYGNARYSGSVVVMQPKTVRAGLQRPNLAKVKVLSKGSALGGSVYRVKVRNLNAAGTAPARVRVTARTTR
jgi:hypothetical protein